MQNPPTPPPPSRPALSQRLLALVDGDLARLPLADREPLVAWQEIRLRIGLGHMLSLLVALAACKVVLVVAGSWPTGLSRWVYAGALAVLVAMRVAYGRASGLLGEGAAATLFLVALMVILADPSLDWSTHPGLALGWVWLLGSLGIPLLARIRSVAVFILLMLAVVLLFFAMVPVALQERLQMLLYLAISIAGGLLLRRMRSDASIHYRRTSAAAAASANTDALTSLANRRGWRQQAPALLARCERDNKPLSLLFIDLDHFKHLNDRHGHAAGDHALRRVGALLQSRVDGGLAARLGGEEFVCLLPGMDTAAAEAFAQGLRADLMQPPRPLTFSGGLVQWRVGEALPVLLARGDAAMYRAKKAGRDRIVHG